ncbi:MAG TPA: hypothetical protein PLZ58_01185 [Candidatus Saccharibacteria bacterium]|nr:hypothetical protein [Candidatus Saccharibacteria bacterium]HRQ07065.1 hypothetical protein [Candidatus Saccharibacteria bacterium]
MIESDIQRDQEDQSTQNSSETKVLQDYEYNLRPDIQRELDSITQVQKIGHGTLHTIYP